MEDQNNAKVPQEDPIVMYLIVRESLNMSLGKTAAQCAHAAQMLTLNYFDLKNKSFKLQKKIASDISYKCPEGVWPELDLDKKNYADMSRKISIFGEWIGIGIRKVVLKADDKEWARLKQECADQMVMVVDAGLTEIPSGSETCIGLWPLRKSQAPKIIKRLQVLK